VAADLIGETLGQFRIVARLGQGGMGVVYRATDEKLRRDVAIKVLPESVTGDADRRRRFLREARTAAAISHPNIATVFDIGEEGGRVYLAMELIEGATLRTRLGRGGIGVGEATRIARQIAAGLARAHDKGIVHRDLKPENVMLTPDGGVKILDFGLAKLHEPDSSESALERQETQTLDGRVMGTPGYMSPEQARGGVVDARSDLFSLGIVLYEMLTGRRPFGGASSAEVLAAIMRDTPEPLAKAAPGAPRELAAIVERCLAKSPEDRWSGAGELLEALEALPPSGSVQSQVAVSVGVRRPLSRVRIAVALVLAVGGIGSFVVLRGRTAQYPGAATPSSPTGSSAAAMGAGERAPLACPALTATGVPEPSGWLGAAASSIVCRRAAILLGGTGGTLVPAELLGLPREPSDHYPLDPYGEPDARTHAIAAAKTRAAEILDGEVDKTAHGFHVTLVVKKPDDSELARAQGDGEELYQAVREAMRPLVRPDVLRRAPSIDPAVAKWTGVSDVDVALQLDDWESAVMTTAAAEAQERGRLPSDLDWLLRRLNLWTTYTTSARTPPAPCAVDRSSPPAFARTAPEHAEVVPADYAALAAEMSALRATEATEPGRRALSLAEARLWQLGGDADHVRQTALRMIQDDPTDDVAWQYLINGFWERRGVPAAMPEYAAWRPDAPGAVMIAPIAYKRDVETSLRFSRRAYALSAGNLTVAISLHGALMRAGEREEARALGVRMLAQGPEMAIGGDGVLARVDASEALFGASLARSRRTLETVQDIGGWDVDYLIFTRLQVALVTEQSRPVADEIARTFFEPDPARIAGQYYGGAAMAQTCTHASADLSRRCFQRLRSLVAAHFFAGTIPDAYIDGCERFAQGDMKGATAAWKPLMEGTSPSIRWLQNVAPIAFDAAGEAELAERVDALNIAGVNADFHGASLAHVRSARRAAARGDRETARKLARQVIDSWSVADVPVPAVAEMRALLAKLQ
jgi:hypothetical protein